MTGPVDAEVAHARAFRRAQGRAGDVQVIWGGGYSQPLASAIRDASARLRPPVFPIALER